jgi:hypothetical protein
MQPNTRLLDSGKTPAIALPPMFEISRLAQTAPNQLKQADGQQ